MLACQKMRLYRPQGLGSEAILSRRHRTNVGRRQQPNRLRFLDHIRFAATGQNKVQAK